jgi:hypothetical protein
MILSASATDILPLRSGLIDLDFQLARSVPIYCSPRLVLLRIEFDEAILNLGYERALRRWTCRSSAHGVQNSNANRRKPFLLETCGSLTAAFSALLCE